jgi:hypothetical protein
MEFSGLPSTLASFFSIGNVVLVLLLLLLLSYLWTLYEFRGMPPGPRYSCIPFLGNMFSFDKGDEFDEMTAR